MSNEEFIAEILMVICFVPVTVYLGLLGLEYVKSQWFMPRYKKAAIFRRIQRESRIRGYVENTRVLR